MSRFHASQKFDSNSSLCQDTTLQFTENCKWSSKKRQGTILPLTEKLFRSRTKCVDTTLQLAKKYKRSSKKRQGTTSVVPKMQQNKGRALAPEGFFSGFSHDALPFFAARLVCVLTLLLVCLPALSQAALYRITGTVVNSTTGDPVRRATVALLSEENRNTVQSVETDNEGNFAFDGLPAAKFPLTASKRGFLTSFYDEHDGGYNTAIVTGVGQQTEGLIFRMTPVASLHGVVAGDSGDPVENAKVMLFLKPHNPGARITEAADTTTDDTGAYDFGDLAPGEYLVAVSAKPWYALQHFASRTRQRPASDPSAALDVAYPVTFFDSTMEEASATPILLAAGSSEEANINLHAVPALHIFLETNIKEEGRMSHVHAELNRTIFGTLQPSESTRWPFPTQTGTVELIGVAPGHYEMTLGSPPRTADLDVTANQQVDPNLGNPIMEISATMRTSSGAALPERMMLSLISEQRKEASRAEASNGIFTFNYVPQGIWDLEAESLEKQLPIISITIGNHTYPGNQLTVSDKPLQVVVTVSLSETRIEGFAKKGEKGAPGVMVVLVPKDLAAFPALARRDQSDSDGSFALRDVAPGQYTVVAIEDGWDLDWARPEVIARYLPGGISVNVTENSGKLVRLSEAVPVESR